MAKTYCLAIDVKSPHIDGGLGYLLSFRTPDAKISPEQTPGFDAWAKAVRSAVQDAGDQPFNPDAYTRKVAIAELMYEIEKINSAYAFKIEGTADRPAVEVQSSNPHDKRVQINFAGEDGHFEVVEKRSAQYIAGAIAEDGRITVLDGDTVSYPFTPVVSGGREPPVAKPRPHLGFRPHF